ncbi:MAG: hypothetical protein ACXVDZ_10585 [Bacteroidia bacterium]
MNIHVGKAILKKIEETGISKSEFARRINRAPQTVQHIFVKQSIDTNLLLDISTVLKFNFFALFLKEDQMKQLGSVSDNKGQLKRLTDKIDKLTEVNNLLEKSLKDKEKSLKDKERIIALLEKKQSKKK